MSEARGQALQVPAGVSCQCVKNHNPQTSKILPWELPSGTVMWLCPTTWYCVKELYDIFVELQGEPIPDIMGRYPLFGRRLVKLHWQQLIDKQKGGSRG